MSNLASVPDPEKRSQSPSGSSLADPKNQPVGLRIDSLGLTEITTTCGDDKILWCWMSPRQRPCFTPTLLQDIDRLQRFISEAVETPETPIEYLVLGSTVPGVYNLGGDLALFAETIRQRDRAALQRYARSCVAVGHTNHGGYHDKVTTLALIEGDALGGGFECALSCDILVAERHVKFMLPEILFNLFPGMGAYSFLTRRIGAHKTETLLTSGRSYSAEDMLEMGVVDHVVETGTGRDAVADLIAQQSRRKAVMRALYQIRRRVNPISLVEMNDITDLWVDTALKLTDMDLRKMTHLAAAQDRLRVRSAPQLMSGLT